uniref:DOP1 N-terminal domain-containing protein n=1 Tax=Salarias fasciatus TaxID=181472 RepID=A0A672JQL4_SALFA
MNVYNYSYTCYNGIIIGRPWFSSLLSFYQALQSNLRYLLLPKRLIIGKRLAQCLHPALPSGVSGLFPLLGHAAMAVWPVLLTLYKLNMLISIYSGSVNLLPLWTGASVMK